MRSHYMWPNKVDGIVKWIILVWDHAIWCLIIIPHLVNPSSNIAMHIGIGIPTRLIGNELFFSFGDCSHIICYMYTINSYIKGGKKCKSFLMANGTLLICFVCVFLCQWYSPFLLQYICNCICQKHVILEMVKN